MNYCGASVFGGGIIWAIVPAVVPMMKALAGTVAARAIALIALRSLGLIFMGLLSNGSPGAADYRLLCFGSVPIVRQDFGGGIGQVLRASFRDQSAGVGSLGGGL